MALGQFRLALVVGSLVAGSLGCAHRGPDPFLFGSPSLVVTKGDPPPCFIGPLADCISDGLKRGDVERLSSRWLYAFQPDLNERVCRGDIDAQERLVDAVRHLADDESLKDASQAVLDLLSGCDSRGFCDWALVIAGDLNESPATRRLFLETVRRGCGDVVTADRLDRAGSDLGLTPSTEYPWVTNSMRLHCADFEFLDDPWADFETTFLGGCLDLGEWLERHSADREGTVVALERCVEQHEIRYREADCLRELAGLDRRRAVDWLRREGRQGFGMASAINRYARVLERFPNDGQLEERLTRLGMIPADSTPTVTSGHSPVLASEILESRGRLVRFSPACAVRYCEHAPLMYLLAATAGEQLDDVTIVESWPALERIDLGTGPRAVSTTVGAIPVTFHVFESDDDETFDRQHLDTLRSAFEQALAEPHELRLYSKGEMYRLTVRNLGEWYDLETLLGGLNTMLADRGSDIRLITLTPHCIPCAQVVAGPREGMIEAVFEGLITVADPYHELWTLPNFDATRLEERRP